MVVRGLAFTALVSILTTVGIIFILGEESFQFFAQVSVKEFLFTTTWAPLFKPRSFGIWPLVNGALIITIGAILFALPLGLGIAIYTSEYATGWWQKVLKPVLELLAGIPSVVYGFFALTQVTPFLQKIFPTIEVFNALERIDFDHNHDPADHR